MYVPTHAEPNQPLSVTNMPSAGTGYNPEADVFSWWSARGVLRDLLWQLQLLPASDSEACDLCRIPA